MSKTNEVDSSETLQPRMSIVRAFFLLSVLWIVLVACLAIVGGIMNGKAGIEKTLSELCYPVGYAWLLASASALFQLLFGNKRMGSVLALAAALIWISGTRFVPDWMTGQLENSVENVFDPATDSPLDVLVVLGGGTRLHDTRAQAGSSGDRVVLAAQLFHSGQAKRLVTTGRVTGGLNHETADLGQQTIEIWTRLGIPRDKIDTLPGMNTYEEVQAVKGLPESVHSQRLGILTSALHLPRAMRLAKAAGFEPIPVAADYRVTSHPRTSLIPSADNVLRMQAAQHEFMAYFLGR